MPSRKVKKVDFERDIARLETSEKDKRAIQCFLEIECAPGFDSTPQQAQTLRKKILKEVVTAIKHDMTYDDKSTIPLWHKLFIAGQDTEHRSFKIRYLLRSLGHQLKNYDGRRRI